MNPDYFQSSSFLLVRLVQSEYGTILKTLSTTNKSLHGCYLEELRILPEGQIGPIKSLQILHSDRSLFVGLDDRLVKIPLERCSSYPTERYDPYRPHACNNKYDVNSTQNFWFQSGFSLWKTRGCHIMNRGFVDLFYNWYEYKETISDCFWKSKSAVDHLVKVAV